jgi:hypothetical protein
MSGGGIFSDSLCLCRYWMYLDCGLEHLRSQHRTAVSSDDDDKCRNAWPGPVEELLVDGELAARSRAVRRVGGDIIFRPESGILIWRNFDCLDTT